MPSSVSARDSAAGTLDQARIASVTAGRDSELDRWRDLYELAVPRPGPAGHDDVRAAASAGFPGPSSGVAA